LIIWIAISVGLKPLRQLTEQLANKQAEDLSPINIESVPKELDQLVLTGNDLLSRLDHAFQREQRFASDAAHELRTPISVLKVHLHNLESNLGDDHTEVFAMQEGLERLEHSVEQILALYRTSPDKAAVEFDSLDLHAMTQQIIADSYDAFEQKQQTITLSGEESVVYANAFALSTLIKNLLSNANKYTPENGHVVVDVKRYAGGVRLCVEDSGVGIPEEAYQRVFDRFYRIDGDRHGSGVAGCGLGLAIVKHIIDLHGGTVMLSKSHFESGLSVTIDLPSRGAE